MGIAHIVRLRIFGLSVVGTLGLALPHPTKADREPVTGVGILATQSAVHAAPGAPPRDHAPCPHHPSVSHPSHPCTSAHLAKTHADSQSSQNSQVVAITGAFCRVLKGVKHASVYMTVQLPHKGAPQDDVLQGAKFSPDTPPPASHIQLHTYGNCTGHNRMQKVQTLDVPQGILTLAPGGHHIMLMDLNRPLTEGERVSLILTFKHAGDIAVRVPVRSTLDWATPPQDSKKSPDSENPSGTPCNCTDSSH